MICQVNKYLAYLLIACIPAAEAFLACGAQSPVITETIHIFSSQPDANPLQHHRHGSFSYWCSHRSRPKSPTVVQAIPVFWQTPSP